ncbi:MAG: ferritin-like domain-containing protein [Magnetovibrio sp.]|nr:ferritin-like domain-containing protein [Magnetovibrio sp.]
MSGRGLSVRASERIAELAAKGERQIWRPGDVVGPASRVIRPTFVPKRLYAAIISQFLHGELATAELCRRLSGAVDDPVARRFLDTQIADETRHADAYGRYLEHFGGIRPIDGNFRRAMDSALDWSGPPQAWLLGFHVLLEGEALRTLADFQASWPCPVFARVNALISRDEARHVAFGKLFLRDTLPSLPPAERQAIYLKVRDLWQATGEGLLSETWAPGFFTRRLRRRWLDDGWRHHLRSFADVGLLGLEEMRALDREAVAAA